MNSQLLFDKYQPKDLSEFTHNLNAVEKLTRLVGSQELPHLAIQGLSGSGKKTLAMAFLKAKFGPKVYNRTVQTHEMSTKSGKTLEIQVVYSPYHYQINPSLYGVYDRLIIQDFLKRLVRFKTINQQQLPYRTVIIDEADKLTVEAQQSLRRTLEQYVSTFRCIFICQNLGNLIDPLQSRCHHMRIASPSKTDLLTILDKTLEGEQVTMSESNKKMLIANNESNLTQLFCDLEYLICKYGGDEEAKTIDQRLKYLDISQIDRSCYNIFKQIYESSDLMIVKDIRKDLHDLLIYGAETEVILKTLFKYAIKQIAKTESMSVQKQIIVTTADHHDRIIRGSKPIYHLESYVVNLFQIIKTAQQARANKK